MVGQMAGMVFSRKTRSEYLSLTGFQPVVQWWPYNSQAITSLPSILRTIYESYLKDEDIRPNIFQLFFRGIAFIYCISLIRSWIYNLSQTTDLKIPLSILFQCHMFNSGKFHCIYRSRVVFFSLLLFTEKFLLEPEMHAFLCQFLLLSAHIIPLFPITTIRCVCSLPLQLRSKDCPSTLKNWREISCGDLSNMRASALFRVTATLWTPCFAHPR